MKVPLIDTVKKEFFDEFMKRISSVVDPKGIDYVISNHTEMDHSGSLPMLMDEIGRDKPIYCSKMGKKNLSMPAILGEIVKVVFTGHPKKNDNYFL